MVDLVTRGRWSSLICNLSHCRLTKLIPIGDQLVYRDKSTIEHKQLHPFFGIVTSSSVITPTEVHGKLQKFIDVLGDIIETKRAVNAAAMIYGKESLKVWWTRGAEGMHISSNSNSTSATGLLFTHRPDYSSHSFEHS